MIHHRRMPLIAALAFSLAILLRPPVPHDDVFFSTLVVLPLIVAGLTIIGRWAHAHGGPRTPFHITVVEIVALGVAILIVIGRSHLGLAPAGAILDRITAAGLVLLLTHRLAWLLRSLRPALGRRLPAIPPWPFLILPLLVYLAIQPWSSVQHAPDGDEPHYLLLTHSLAYDFDTDLRNNYERSDSLQFMDRRLQPQPGDPEGRHGELYSRHNMLLPLLLAPAYRVVGLPGALAMMALFTALVSWLTLALAHVYFPERVGEAMLAWLVLAFTSPLLLYSYQVWVEVPAALLSVIALLCMEKLRREHRHRWVYWIGLALALLLLPLTKIRFLAIALPLAVLAVWRLSGTHRKLAISLLMALVTLAAAIFLFNQQVFRNPLKYHDIDGLRTYLRSPLNYLEGFTGLFFDCAFGLFAFAPIWMLLVPAAFTVLRHRSRLVVDFAAFIPYLLLLVPRGEWFGAWSPPFRYGVAPLPLLALWLVPLFSMRRRPALRAAIGACGALTLGLTLLYIVEPGWTYNLAHGRNHLLDHLARLFSADVARFFPSSTRIRLATWLWPLLTLVFAGLLSRLPKPWRSPRAMSWGVSIALLLVALVPLAATRRATRIIEFEDPWVQPERGSVYPPLWVVYRPQFRGGWLVPSGRSVTVPVVPAGDRLRLEISLRPDRPLTAEGQLLVRQGAASEPQRIDIGQEVEWREFRLSEMQWTGDAPLQLAFEGPPRSGLILDRARLRWLPSSVELD